MSKIERLQIGGVRSFSPTHAQTIRFTGPLTLIVGSNGSGKTTVIECLKYATTGELPPNSKTGGAFIHDPKLCGEKEVMAQVRLLFTSTSGARMVLGRRLQVTVKKATRSQKTLEGSLSIKQNGETTSISTRVAELDAIVPQYLGVSKAILENVIFCHQDDSLWPLSEPSVLKKKFDEIFEALKYTKAIDNIKVLRKAQNDELAKLKISEQYAKDDKQRGAESEKKQAELYDKIEEYRNQLVVLDADLAEAQTKAKDAFDRAARFEQIVAQLNGKRIQLKANQESISELESDIKHLAESDDELQSMLGKYEQRVSEYEGQKDGLVKQYNGLKNDMSETHDDLGRKQSEIGKYQAQKEEHDRRLLKREDLIKETAKTNGIRGFEYEITDSKAAEFLDIIERISRDQNKALDRARQESQSDLRDAQNSLDELNRRKFQLSQNKENSKTQITANDKRIADLQRTMHLIKIDEGSEATLQERKNDIDERLKTAISAAKSDRFDERIEVAETAARNLDAKKEMLDNELGEATRFARDTAQVTYAQDELKKAQYSFTTMKNVHGSRIAQIVDPDWDPTTLESSFQRTLSKKDEELKAAESRRDIAQSKLDGVNFKISSLQEQQRKKRSELQKYEKIVQDAISQDDITSFDETLQGLEDQYEMSSTDQAKFQANIDYMRVCLKTAQDHDMCRLCKRSLDDDRSQNFTRAGFLQTLEKIITKAEQNAEDVNIEEVFAELEAARNAKPSHELALRLRSTELPTLESELNSLTKEREVINKQLEDHDAVIYDLREAKQDVESLSKDVQSIVNYTQQCDDLKKKIEDLTEKQKAAGLSRSSDNIEEDRKKVGEQLRSANADLSRLSAEKEKSRNLIHSLEVEIRDVDAELSGARGKLREKTTLMERIEEFKSQNSENRDAVRAHDRDIELINPLIEEAKAKYEDVNRRADEKAKQLHADANKVSNNLRHLKEEDDQIKAYVRRGGPKQLEKTEGEIEELKQQESRIETDMNEITRRLKKIQDHAQDTETMRRTITDNIRYRKAKRSIDNIQKQIKDLESSNAERDRTHYENEGTKWQYEATRLTTERTSVFSTIRARDDDLQERINEYNKNFKGAAMKYKEAHIKVETTKAAIEDLGRYGGALDKAIMKYHSLKMEQINDNLGELWKSAYRGTDIDTIRIRSDNESAKGNRSYNYRVVMVKQDTEMDMRGRCSAGQKVLASIVIRLALSESFGANCGLIALDEPTTNLDTENIRGLARSLSEIIRIRQKQANFQLIVITHDENFLRDMHCDDYADNYYKVSRNADQQSTIEPRQISELM
ncbi:DNA repair protein rad50 [Dendryphion nanum]|uniref:DNA repair protein RAD50 n=1 Tax=Dendryphion nanum TaxID=256645 RepID=A0A9P9EJQ1_9PLEO|nr:DNA repair protein rad50 [Dendryphion nanum]